MAFNLKNKSKDPISEINVTPFVDVMLVLLIVFMVTAPLLTVGVQVDLPESSADSLPEEQEPLTLSINSKGEIFIQESKVEFDNVIAKILAVSKLRQRYFGRETFGTKKCWPKTFQPKTFQPKRCLGKRHFGQIFY